MSGPSADHPPRSRPTVAITGASGALGQALLQAWHCRGAELLALTHGTAELMVLDAAGNAIPLRQVSWQVGQEEALGPVLESVDVLVLNHGVNLYGARDSAAVATSLEVNALSSWRLLELFAQVAERRSAVDRQGRHRPEVWLNTSEAEIQPALSPLYEISKRLLGQLLSLRALDLAGQPGSGLRLRRLVLGPFRSALNPIGLMSSGFVAREILRQADWDLGLIIVTPNPLTYVLMPLTALSRWLYFRLCSRRSWDAPQP
ncbi:short-chain dehydrogenase [Synechococcus sp. CS-1328]|uniref:short-chain dehydrogenase n=1 Tax=Synechococcus sp. CS-1328 TaxID=2847976 RepID=UPI00223AD147|nr:short-chain dehydrogenase [Synechococcus sp. CS-1328]MCT0225944.1 short-chain dehydrogenase [Synechococcus sp. CS-1328]